MAMSHSSTLTRPKNSTQNTTDSARATFKNSPSIASDAPCFLSAGPRSSTRPRESKRTSYLEDAHRIQGPAAHGSLKTQGTSYLKDALQIQGPAANGTFFPDSA